MGSGKTSWAIDYINSNPDDSIIFVTPFLDQVDRIKDSCKRSFYDPQPWGHSKHDDFNKLLEEGRDIVTTHATFSRADARTLGLLKDGNYTLIIDEAVDPLINFNDACNDNIKTSDINLLINEGFISIDQDNAVQWLKPDYKDSKYWKVAYCAKNKNLYYLDNTLLAWQFPPQIFCMFHQVFVLTYLFKGSFMYPFFQSHNIDFKMVSIAKENGKYSLCGYSDSYEKREAFANLITIFDDKKHPSMFTYKNRMLSSNWYRNADQHDIAELKKNIGIFIRAVNADKSRIMWTTYKAYQKLLKGKGYTQAYMLTRKEKSFKGRELEKARAKAQCYVACNSRATNDFKDRDILLYLINFYPNEYIARYYTNKRKSDGEPIEFDRDLWTLSNFLQWLFRSAIREGKPVTLYLPSTRMRHLLTSWLQSDTM